MRISDRDRRIVSMWLDGLKSEAIAAEIGVTRGVILRRVGDLGLPRRLPGKNYSAASLWPCIFEWARSGFTPTEIATGIGCTKPSIVAAIE